MKGWVWIIRWLLFRLRYARLYQVHHEKHEEFTTSSPSHIYINRNNNRLVFKVKDGHRLELKTPEKMKLFGSTKKQIGEIKHGENILSFEAVEAFLV